MELVVEVLVVLEREEVLLEGLVLALEGVGLV